MADCRLCQYFVKLEELDENTLHKALVQAARRGEKALGWCTYFDRVVTYYEGRCRAFVRKEVGRQTSILEFV